MKWNRLGWIALGFTVLVSSNGCCLCRKWREKHYGDNYCPPVMTSYAVSPTIGCPAPVTGTVSPTPLGGSDGTGNR